MSHQRRTADRILAPISRLRGRHVAAYWILVGIVLTVLPDQSALLRGIVAIPLAVSAIALVTLWVAARNLRRRDQH